MVVTKGSCPITSPSQYAGGIDSGIFSNFARRTDHEPTFPSPIMDGKVAWLHTTLDEENRYLA